LPPGHRAFTRLLAAMQALASAMCATQRPNGAWWAVAQSPESGPEASTEAFMAEGLGRGVERGWLPRERYMAAAAAAWRATLEDTDSEGTLRDVSAAVWSSTSDLHYHHVPKGFVVPWGQGPLLLAAARWHRSETQLT
jgi:unsaturated rhamnogalacturonyl hydrolase